AEWKLGGGTEIEYMATVEVTHRTVSVPIGDRVEEWGSVVIRILVDGLAIGVGRCEQDSLLEGMFETHLQCVVVRGSPRSNDLGLGVSSKGRVERLASSSQTWGLTGVSFEIRDLVDGLGSDITRRCIEAGGESALRGDVPGLYVAAREGTGRGRLGIRRKRELCDSVVDDRGDGGERRNSRDEAARADVGVLGVDRLRDRHRVGVAHSAAEGIRID